MKGWKTFAGGLIAIALGAYLIIFDSAKFEYGAGLVGVGLMGMGIGHKLDRQEGGKK